MSTDPSTEEPTEAVSPTEEPTADPQPAEVEAVPFDLGDATLVQADYVPERVREMPVRLNGMMAVPPAGDNLPLAVIIHGSHGSGCPSPDGVTEGCPCPGEERLLRHTTVRRLLCARPAFPSYHISKVHATKVYPTLSGNARSIKLPIRNQRLSRHVSQEFRLGLVSPIGQDGHMDGHERTSKWTLFRPKWTRMDTNSGHQLHK